LTAAEPIEPTASTAPSLRISSSQIDNDQRPPSHGGNDRRPPIHRDGSGPPSNEDAAGPPNDYFPEAQPFTLSALRRGWGDEIADRVLSYGRHYSTSTGQPYWLAEDLNNLLGLADMELRQEREDEQS
jgi:hypothetical protein